MLQDQYDAIVVGSGPGGASVSKELTTKGKRVLILEWGDNAPVAGSVSQFVKNAGIPGRSLLFTDKRLLGMVRGICTGGSSIFYCATAFDPPFSLMRSYGIDLEDEVAALKAELPIAPLADDLMGPGARRMMESALDLGYDWKPLNKFIFQDKCRPGCAKCTYGCPYGAKWTARNYVEEATTGGAELVNGAKVQRVIMENGKAVGVEYRKNHRTHQAFADNTILSAGGIGTPVSLRKSGIEDAGHDFFFDPLIMVFGTVDGLPSVGEPQMAAGAHMEEEGYLMVDLSFSDLLFGAQSTLRLRPHRGLSRSKTLMLMVKAKDSLGGRVTPRGGVRKSLSPDDNLKLKAGYERGRQILKHAGARGIFSGWKLAAHPGGTVKINHLVDSDLKTECDNLYVCDCSVIPEAWGLPPTLTLLALGRRLSGHLSRVESEKGKKMPPAAR